MAVSKKIEIVFENIIFSSRWIQAPIYGGLIIGSILYAYKFLVELIHLCMSVGTIAEEVLMLGILTLVDISMVLNLLVMVIIGGYATFVSRMHLDHHEDRPDWLEKVDAGTLKVKLAGALVGISGIHLLKSFINIGNKDFEQVKWQILIHVVFLFSTLMLAYTEKVMHSSHGGGKSSKQTAG
ncbi:MAG: TIGR00645 family protein [Calothrix sp. SM1_5_4]|nr:TIGR00645 family protein [Calothrix sp. SM1_5_4]